MLAKVTKPTNDFHALARYLVNGKSGKPPPNRVAWTFAQNLPTDDPDIAAKLMAATAQLSQRVQNAVYHLMVAWAPHEKPSPDIMQHIARQTLQLAGLEEHQALVMGHGDTPHKHFHIMLNRVHPETGKAWKTANDYARFDAIMRQLSDEHGFQYAPAHSFNPERTSHLNKKPNSKAFRAGKRGAPTNRLQLSRDFSRILGTEISQILEPSAGWEDIATALEVNGFALEEKGEGLVAGNSESYVKFSHLGLTSSGKAPISIIHRPAQPRRQSFRNLTSTHKRHPLFTVDAVDIVRALMVWGLTDKDDLHAAIDAAGRARADGQPTKPTSIPVLCNKTSAVSAATSLSTVKPAPSTRPHPGRKQARQIAPSRIR